MSADLLEPTIVFDYIPATSYPQLYMRTLNGWNLYTGVFAYPPPKRGHRFGGGYAKKTYMWPRLPLERFERLPNNQIALKADNNYYVSHVDRDQSSLEASKSSIDAKCRFTVKVVSSPT